MSLTRSSQIEDILEVIRDTIGTALVQGAGITITVNDAGDTITIASTVTQYTDEMVRDVMGVALVQGSGITITVNDAGDTITISAPVPTITKHSLLPFSYKGSIVAGAGTFRLYVERTLTITAVRVALATAPTGSSVIIDVNKNGTTIFTDQAHRPAIAVSSNTATAGTIDVTSLAAGDYLTVDIDQIGSTVAGADLTVTVEVAE